MSRTYNVDETYIPMSTSTHMRPKIRQARHMQPLVPSVDTYTMVQLRRLDRLVRELVQGVDELRRHIAGAREENSSSSSSNNAPSDGDMPELIDDDDDDVLPRHILRQRLQAQQNGVEVSVGG